MSSRPKISEIDQIIADMLEDKMACSTLELSLALEVKRLRQILGKLVWASIDKDNMEFQCKVTCYEMDAIRIALRG